MKPKPSSSRDNLPDGAWKTALLFIAAVLVPGIALSVIAIRASGREEAYLEKRLTTALSAEVAYTASQVAALASSFQIHLDSTAPALETITDTAVLDKWKSGDPLVGKPFVFLRKGRFAVPDENKAASMQSGDREFLRRNQDFFQDRRTVDVYRNVVKEFAQGVLKKSGPDAYAMLDDAGQERMQEKDDYAEEMPLMGAAQGSGAGKPAGPSAVQAPASAAPQARMAYTDQADERAMTSADAAPEMEKKKSARTSSPAATAQRSKEAVRQDQAKLALSKKSEALQQQAAMNAFEQDEGFKAKVYQEAQKRSKLASRVTVPQRKSYAPKAEVRAEPSLYITESLRFSQIVSAGTSGIIPRLVDDRMTLVYWKKLGDTAVVGCELSDSEVRGRIIAALPSTLDKTRILTVLDHNGAPLFKPQGAAMQNWREPYVSREISDILPQWETAAYLADPGTVAAAARRSALFVAALVGLLLISILIGGILVLRSLGAEMRLAAQKTTFVANVSHELKTPLTSIRLFAEILKQGRQADPARQKRYLDIMVSEAERLTRLINNVLDFSRKNRGGRKYAMRKVDMASLITELMEFQQVRLEHNGFFVTLSCPDTEVWVQADSEAIKQVLLNLLSNAEKYSPNEKWISLVLSIQGDLAVVSIADHGVGISADHAENIFKEFYRVDDSLTAPVRGTGLGLTISRQIARDHGGDVAFKPNQPIGSVFELRLPMVPGKKPSA